MKYMKIKLFAIVLLGMLVPLQAMAAESQTENAVIIDETYTEKENSEETKICTKEKSVIQPRYQYRVVTDGGNLNVRDYPSTTTGKIIGSIPNGTIVEVPFMQPPGTPDGWDYISSPIAGYVASQYIQ